MKASKKAFKAALKVLGASFEDVLVCAEYTGRYIYPLTIACQELSIFLWMDDPTRIKNSMGLTRGKNDAIDAEWWMPAVRRVFRSRSMRWLEVL